MYIDYSTYKAKGGTFSETDFGIYESLAEAEIRSIIGDALPPESTLITCMMLLLNAYQKAETPTPQSMSNDGLSVTYHSEGENPLRIALSRIRLILADVKINTRSRAVKCLE